MNARLVWILPVLGVISASMGCGMVTQEPAVDAAPLPVLGFAPGEDTVQYGGTGGQLFEDVCPTGQVLTGFYGELLSGEDVWHRLITGLCSVATLSSDGVGGFSVSLRAGATLPTRGTSGGTPWMRSCPANQVVVGFGGRVGLYLDQLAIHCAPLVVTGSAGALSISVGSPTALEPVGGLGGSEFPDTDCPPGQVARTLRVLAAQYIDAFGLGCVTPIAD